MDKLRVGMCFSGSFCTFDKALECMKEMVDEGWDITPIFSYHAATLDTRFGRAEDFLRRSQEISGHAPMLTMQDVEPIGPKNMLDVMVVLPCTGNTLAKLACGIVDTPVVMAVKSILRGGKPVVLGLSTNDGLGAAAKNIGALLERRSYYFLPFSQDNPVGKPRSLTPDYTKLMETVSAALRGAQIQPILA